MAAATARATASTYLAGEVRKKINPIHKSLQIERNKVHFYFLFVTFIYYKVIFSLFSSVTLWPLPFHFHHPVILITESIFTLSTVIFLAYETACMQTIICYAATAVMLFLLLTNLSFFVQLCRKTALNIPSNWRKKLI